MSFENKNIVITGGNSGIGAGIAAAFHKAGANIVIFGRNQKTLQATADQLGDRVTTVAGDVASLADLDVLFNTVKDRLGSIDALVVNAGVAPLSPIEAVDEAHYDKVMDINLKGAFFTAQKALPLLNEGGSIQFVASVVGYKGIGNLGVYSASKAGLQSIARSFAAELAPKKIRVNSISPGPITTPIYDRMNLPEDQKAGMEEMLAQSTALKRFGRAEEVAALSLYLASEGAGYITAVDIPVDGGFTYTMA